MVLITQALLDFFFNIANLFISLFPAFDISSLGGFAAIVTSLAACSAFMPIQAFTVSLYVWVSFHMYRFSMSLANYVIRKIPTIE